MNLWGPGDARWTTGELSTGGPVQRHPLCTTVDESARATTSREQVFKRVIPNPQPLLPLLVVDRQMNEEGPDREIPM